MGSLQQYVHPELPGHGPDLEVAGTRARAVNQAMALLRSITPGSGAYVNEADYFEPDWPRSFWRDNYPGLLRIKQRHDPTNLFRVHHGVGSDS